MTIIMKITIGSPIIEESIYDLSEQAAQEAAAGSMELARPNL